jgi:hypothetical protein
MVSPSKYKVKVCIENVERKKSKKKNVDEKYIE